MKNKALVESWRKFLNEQIETNEFGIDQFSQNEIVDEAEKNQAIDLICRSLKDSLQDANVIKINEDYTMYKFEISSLGINILISGNGMMHVERTR